MRGILFQVIESELNRYFHRNAANMKTRTMPDNVYEFKPKVLIPLDQICESVKICLPVYAHIYRKRYIVKKESFSTFAKFSEKLTFLIPYTHTYVCVSGVRNISFSENFANVLKE